MFRRFASLVVMIVLLASVAPVAASAAPTVAPPQTTDLQQASPTDVGECRFPYAATDSTGTNVTLEERPDRVVTLNPSAAQTMWEIGGREQVVGVSQFAGYLDGADERTVVTSGNPATPRIETIVGLEPDLVLAPNTISEDSVDSLRDAGLTVYRFELASTIEDVYAKTLQTGRLTGNCEEAAGTVESMRERIDGVRAAVEGRDRPSVYYPLGGGYTAGTGTFVHEIIRAAGGHNIAADANISSYAVISAETVVERDPRYLIVTTTNDTVEDPRSLVPEGEAVRQTTAWEEGNIVVLNTNYVNQPAPRIVRPVSELARALHPDAFGETTTDATAEAGTATDAATTQRTIADGGTADVDDDTAEDGDAADDGASDTATPGFGFAAFVVALLAALLFVRR